MTAAAQYAALPYRETVNGLEFLLITTRRTRRWIVPKGWPMDGHAPHAAAAREALEEAGVSGEVSEKPIGSYRYFKERKSGETVPCKVEVFALRVKQQRKSWMEKDLRELRWCSLNEALACVGEPGLRQLISRFAAARAK
ncbi:MAG TPA: NUDIX hydrolase [Rhizomicrobium sp.]|nr:NUDIX hydrolase [Rhizomicrobium sp.]